MLLDEMAPYRRLTSKEIKTENSPWITRGILQSITNRDKLHKLYLKEKNDSTKAELFSQFKQKRNTSGPSLNRLNLNTIRNFLKKIDLTSSKLGEKLRKLLI